MPSGTPPIRQPSMESPAVANGSRLTPLATGSIQVMPAAAFAGKIVENSESVEIINTDLNLRFFDSLMIYHPYLEQFFETI